MTEIAPARPPWRAMAAGRKGGPLPDVDHASIVEVLKANPDVWHRIHVQRGTKTNMPARIRSGAIPEYRPAGTFDASQRRIGEREWEIVAVYLGDAPGA